ncbi:DUF2622 domain-containing protein [Rouxiella sp. Mn2063]|uniref:DUF2622 domain-containing protein n=1 Tax=Rouxiella sp. Mn2063 TaxID=3395262 RepID=UPI003BBD328F
MDNFTVRIALRNATADDYAELDAKMKAKGFKTTITGENGKVYDLPAAEYNYSSGSDTVAGVNDKARDIAQSVKALPAVIVSKVVARAWSGLTSD